MNILTPTEARRDLRRSPALRRALRSHRYDPDVVAGLSAERIRETLQCIMVGAGVHAGMSVMAGKSGWTPPASDTSLQAWYKPGNWDTDGSGEISQWHDAGLLGAHATQGTALNRPTAATLGGLQYSHFVAANTDHLIANAVTAVVNGDDQPHSVFFRFRLASSSDGAVMHWSDLPLGSPPDTTHYVLQVQSRASPPDAFRVRKVDDAFLVVDVSSAEHLTDAASDHVISFVTDGSTMSAWLDGALLTNFNGANCNIGTLAADKFTIGAQRNDNSGSATAPFDGYIRQILIYDAALSTAQRENIEANI